MVDHSQGVVHAIPDADHFAASILLEQAGAIVEMIAHHNPGNASDSKVKSAAAWAVLEKLEQIEKLLRLGGAE